MRRIAIAVLLASRVAAAAPSEAERLYKDGQTAYDDKRYDDAITAWSKSYELSHLPGLVFNLAQAYRLHGDCDKAVETYQKFLDLDPKSKQRAAAEGFLHELQPCHVEPPPPELPPTPPPTTTQPIPPQPPVKIVKMQPSADHGHGKRLAGIVTATGGVVLVAAGAYFGSQASSLAADVNKACAAGCDFDSIKQKDADGRSDARTQYILYGVGGAAITTGVILYLMGSHAEHAPVAVTPVRGGAALSFSGRW